MTRLLDEAVRHLRNLPDEEAYLILRRLGEAGHAGSAFERELDAIFDAVADLDATPHPAKSGVEQSLDKHRHNRRPLKA